jgi:integrase/recombinase XerD
MSEKPISDLRRRMLEDMAVRHFGEKTKHDYIRHVESFARFLGRSPDTATAEDVRRFQVHLTESGVQAPTLNSSASALPFFFATTLDRAEIARHLARVHYPRKLPRMLCPEEVGRLLGSSSGSGSRPSEPALEDSREDNLLLRSPNSSGEKIRIRTRGLPSFRTWGTVAM